MNEASNQCLSNVQAAIEAGKALGAPVKPSSAQDVILVPDKFRIEALEKFVEQYGEAPRRIKAHPHLASADSFIQYVGLFKSGDTRIFAVVPANNGAPSFLAILDYHSPEGPQWGDHKAKYECQFTEEWKRWMASDRKRMGQVEFATFLEENQALITAPPGAELLELIQTLEGKNDIKCNSLIRLTNGKQKLMYEEDVELKGMVSTQQGQVDMPTSLGTAIAPFDGGPAYKVTCRLKYRIENRRIVLWYECIDVHLVLKDVVKGVVERIEEKLAVTVLYGQP